MSDIRRLEGLVPHARSARSDPRSSLLPCVSFLFSHDAASKAGLCECKRWKITKKKSIEIAQKPNTVQGKQRREHGRMDLERQEVLQIVQKVHNGSQGIMAAEKVQSSLQVS
jgi:hypothetical protein